MNQQTTYRLFIELSAIVLFFVSIGMIVRRTYLNKKINEKLKIKNEKLKTLQNEVDIAMCKVEISQLQTNKKFNIIIIWISIICLIGSIIVICVFAWNGSANWFPSGKDVLYSWTYR